MIFLSASIPDQTGNPKYYDSADIIAIRDAVRALVTVVLPKSYLVWGGHPAITPLIRYVMTTMEYDIKNHVTLYQSNFFRRFFPEDNEYFENVVIVPEMEDKTKSLYKMRYKMLTENIFEAGVFIGGMEGVEEEYEMFKSLQPTAKIFPVASTGAASKIIFQNYPEALDQSLQTDYAYMALFRSLFKQIKIND
ncbi:MAG: hypothetical protein KBF82_00015 [Chitinophagaceae bacterium]|nr:hypothetical protein [Chitinophagaceae bacterium]